MKKKVTIYLNGATPVMLKDKQRPGRHRGIMREAGLAKRERGKPGTYAPTYSQSEN